LFDERQGFRNGRRAFQPVLVQIIDKPYPAIQEPLIGVASGYRRSLLSMLLSQIWTRHQSFHLFRQGVLIVNAARQ
jgi:hypothetical protein